MMAPRFVALLLVVTCCAASPAPDPATALVGRLGHKRYVERERASRELLALGEEALPALQAAETHADPEVRQRAVEIANRITAVRDMGRLAQPTPIELNYTNVPLTTVLPDLVKRTGAAISFGGFGSDPRKLVEEPRKVTIVSEGPIPFWEALALVCRKAGLMEQGGPNGNNDPSTLVPIPAGGQIQIRGRAGARIRQFDGNMMGMVPGQIVLVDGTAPDLPVCVAGAVRVRCVPTPAADAAVNGSTVALQVNTEPKLPATGPPSVRIDRAIDATGKVVEATVSPILLKVDSEEFAIINGALVPQPAMRAGNAVAVRLAKGATGPLRELVGSAAMPVRITEPLAVLEGAPKAGMVARGREGVTLEVTEASESVTGRVRLKLRIELPPDVTPGDGQAAMAFAQAMGVPMVIGGGNVIARQRMMIGGNLPSDNESLGLKLFDAQGRALTSESVNTSQQMPRAGGGMELIAQVSFRPATGVGAPTKLAFTGSRPGVVEVPFVLKNLPLP